MRTLNVLLLALVACITLPACMSSRVAEQNRKGVGHLGEVLVAIDPANEPLVTEAVTNADAIVDGAGFWTQVVNLGPPSAEIQRNGELVEEMGKRYEAGRDHLDPAAAADADLALKSLRAVATDLVNEGLRASQVAAGARTAAGAFPWGESAIAFVLGAGALAGEIWRRNRKRPAATPTG